MFTYSESLKRYKKEVKEKGLSDVVLKLDLVKDYRGDVNIGISLEVEGKENYFKVKKVLEELRKKYKSLRGNFWGGYYEDGKKVVDWWGTD